MITHLRQEKYCTVAECAIGGVSAILDISGALFFPETRQLIVADMHLEKGTSGARRGIFLPPYDSAVTLKLLSQTVIKFAPLQIIFLGDSFHDSHAPFRLAQEELVTLQALSQTYELIWITGNHDPEIPKAIAANSLGEWSCGGLHFTHIPQVGTLSPQISGHLHPVATVTSRGRTIRRRCFASDGTRMILPAFGAYTGGLNIRDKAFDGLFKQGELVSHILGEQGIYSLPVTAKNRV